MVTGSGSKTSDSEGETNNFEPILERFAPYTKLYLEKEWEFQTSKKGLEAYREWINWVAANHPETYHKIQKPIDILIATDALSEGQNLQDADMVVNYDIHWNPVRIIQRMGRIDRLGNPNQKIFSINFWPSNNINTYLNLQGRIEERMAAMKLTGVEVDEELTERFQRMASDASLDQKMNNRMLKQMETTLEDLEGEKSFGFDDLSLERHRQDLLEEFNQNKEKYLRMPNGVYTGFRADTSVCIENGLIALLGYPARPAKSPEHKYITYELIYIDKNGQLVLKNQKEILDALTHHKNKERCVPDAVEQGDEHAIQELADSLKKWLERQANEEPINVVAGLRRGNRDAVARMRQNADVEEKFQMDNFDLITWFLLTANEE